MWIVNHGALAARRWGRILSVGLASCALAACATTPEGRNPPEKCSRGSARPANPNGSVILQNSVQGAALQQDGNAVMVFGQDHAAPAQDATIPAPPATGEATSETGKDLSAARKAPTRKRRSISMGSSPAMPRTLVGSC